MSSAEETIRNELKPTKSELKSVPSAAARSPAARTGRIAMPSAAGGSRASRRRSKPAARASGLSPGGTASRRAVEPPKPVFQQRRPAARLTKAFGVGP